MKTDITKRDIEDLLHDCRLSKTEWAGALGIHRGTVFQWGDHPPRYAVAFLEERKKFLELKKRVAL